MLERKEREVVNLQVSAASRRCTNAKDPITVFWQLLLRALGVHVAKGGFSQGRIKPCKPTAQAGVGHCPAELCWRWH